MYNCSAFFMEFVLYILAGAGVGLAIGMTGVGGGSLMTPILSGLFGFPLNVAVGTDLLYAAITKTSGVVAHHRKRNINWRLVVLLAIGSVPASVCTAFLLKNFFTDADAYEPILTSALGVMLILTSLVLIFRKKIQATHATGLGQNQRPLKHAGAITLAAGVFLGVFVTLSSVGAGAFCAALLLVLYPRLSAIQVIGTDIAHAVPLTLIAGLGHVLLLGNINWELLAGLLIGSIPAIHAGTYFASRLPNGIMHPILASILLVMGCRFAFF